MTYLRTICLAAATMALSLIFNAGSASATVFCSTLSSPCTGTVYSKEAVIALEVNPEVSPASVLESAEFKMECPKQNLKWIITQKGSSTETVVVADQGLVFTGCPKSWNVVAQGSMEIHYTSAGSGTVTVSGIEAVYPEASPQCVYKLGVGGAADLGTLTGGASPALKVSAVFKRSSGNVFTCGAETRWTAEFRVTTPTPLYVAAS